MAYQCLMCFLDVNKKGASFLMVFRGTSVGI